MISGFFCNHKYYNDRQEATFTSCRIGSHLPSNRTQPQPAELMELELDESLRAITYMGIDPGSERIDKGNYVSDRREAMRKRTADAPLLLIVRNIDTLATDEEDALISTLYGRAFSSVQTMER